MTDSLLRLDILDQLDFEPAVEAGGIEVSVTDGVATLAGHVPCYGQKLILREIVETVVGVRAVSDLVEVRLRDADRVADDEIARRLHCVLGWTRAVPRDTVRVAVSGGRVTLSGEVAWRFEAEEAERLAGGLAGVVAIDNRLAVRPAARAEDVSERIRRALLRDAELDASGIRVEVADGVVTLEGRVRYPGERRSAERAAWAAPGVVQVVDRLAVS